MAKFSGKVGYVDGSTETAPGVWVENVTERLYMGDVIRETKQWKETERLNDNLSLSNRISIVADDFAISHLYAMKYVIWSGVYWTVSNIEVQRPRLILSIGGVYNGPKVPTPD
jgi:hypothetical protein